MRNRIIYLGFRSISHHCRGVEQVILEQYLASKRSCIYICWSKRTEVNRISKGLVEVSLKKDLFWPLRLVILLNRLSPNEAIVHSHNGLMSLFALRRVDIYTVHDTMSDIAKRQGKYVVPFKIIELILYSRANKIHVVSNHTMNRIPAKFLQKVDVIYNTSRFENSYLNPQQKALSLERVDILIVRSIEERANFPLIINFAKVNPEVRVHIIGKGPLLESYRKMTQSLKNLIWHGFVSDADLLLYYNKASVIVVPALWGEGFGLPVIEGYSLNKLVLASAVEALPEVIKAPSFLFRNTLDSFEKAYFSAKKYAEYNLKHFEFRSYYMSRFAAEIIHKKYNNLYRDC